MKVGVMSDSHDNVPKVKRAVEFFESAGCEALLHAGDIVAPFSLVEVAKFKGGPVYAVFGNNDGERKGLAKMADIVEGPRQLKLGGRNFVLTHEREKAAGDALREADIVIFGHNHNKEIARGKTLWVNPGETGGWVTGHCTIAVVDCESLSAELVEI
jgi:hypothetical protein